MKKILSILLSAIIVVSCSFGIAIEGFAATPNGTTITTLTAGKTTVTLKWKKPASKVTGYQIKYSKKSNFTNSKTTTVSGYSTTSKKITGLSSGRKYYFRIRTYKTVNGKKTYSSWSKYRTSTTKSTSTKSTSKTVYITPTGKKYHYNNHCNNGTYIKSSLSEAKSRGLTPCKKCVL